jgi:hypothetical protein
MELTDWLLIVVLWFQVANLLFQLWPKLMQLRHHGEAESKTSVKGKDAYETLFGGEEHEK